MFTRDLKAPLRIVAFFAPPERLALSACASALATIALRLSGLPSNVVPYIAWFVALAVTRSWPALSVQPVGLWDRAWPVLDKTLLRTRFAAPWLVGWVPNLASHACTAALCALGVVTTAELGASLVDGALLFALTPTLSLMPYPFERGSEFWLALVVGGATMVFAVIAVRLLPTLTAQSLSLEEMAPFVLGVGGAVTFAAYLVMRGDSWFAEWLWRVRRLPTSSSRGRTDQQIRGDGATQRARSVPSWIVLRTLYGHSYGMVWLLGLLIFAALSVLRPTFLLVLASAAPGWLSSRLGIARSGPFAGHLPIAPRKILLLAVAPLCVCITMFLALGPHPLMGSRAVTRGTYQAQWPAAGAPGDTVPDERLMVPSFFWRLTLGEPPLVTAPNGQSRRPWGYRPLPSLPLTLYNPFDARLRDDAGFVSYQVSRALQEAASMSVSPADVESTCRVEAPGLTARERDVIANSFPFTCLFEQYEVPSRLPWAFSMLRAWLCVVVVWVSLRHQFYTAARHESWKLKLAHAAILTAAWAVYPVAYFAITALNANDPTGSWPPFFTGSVLAGELTLRLERAPLAIGSLLSLLAALAMWDIVRRFERAEPFSGRQASSRTR